MALYKHPTVISGDVTRGDEKYAVRAGCVECPKDLGEGAHWALPTPTETKAYENHPDSKAERKAAADAAARAEADATKAAQDAADAAAKAAAESAKGDKK